MIHTIRELCCAAIGALLVICIVAYKEPWAIVPLVVLVPWPAVLDMAAAAFDEIAEMRRAVLVKHQDDADMKMLERTHRER